MITDFSILYIEDDKLTQRIVVSVLERYFSQIYIAKDGLEGLERYDELNPDIVLTDISMPYLNGMDMIKEIKKINPKQKVILFTSYSELDYFQSAIDMGVNKYILKPLDTHKMLLALEDVLKGLIKERKEAVSRERLEFASQHDELTGLLNRRHFFFLLEKLLHQSDRVKKIVAILALDLNKFKEINDTYGHEAGDLVLKRVAKNLLNATRKGDIVARFGGDEFAIAIGFLKQNNKVLAFLERISNSFETPLNYVDSDGIKHAIEIACSIGITFHAIDDGFPNLETLLKEADRAMYSAKALNLRYRFFDAKEESAFKVKMKKHHEIKQGISRGEFILYYQPIVEIETQEIVAFESLIRWEHPTDGLLIPNDFLHYILDDIEVITALGSWIVEALFRQYSQWLEIGFESKLSINLSYNELLSPKFIDIIKGLLAKYSTVQSKEIIFEVGEKVALEEIALGEQTLNQLKELGFKVALDNFGTGVSTLATIKCFNIDSIKIDKSFVMGMRDDAENYSIVDASIKLAKAFGHTVVAQGVEHQEDFSILLKLGCEQAQGFAIAKPMSALEVIKFKEAYSSSKSFK